MSKLAERPNEEIWELTIPGRVNVEAFNPRGGSRTVSAKGKGQRLRLSTEDRLLNQERIRDPENDPFTNGMLIRIDSQATPADKSPEAFTEDELLSLFGLPLEDFEAVVSGLGQVPVRRLRALVDKHGSVAQSTFLVEQIETRWPVTSGDTAVYREMQTSPL